MNADAGEPHRRQILDVRQLQLKRYQHATLLEPADPNDLLVEQSRDAEIVVLGSRGQSRLTTLLAGSTTLSVVRRAHSTVVAIRSRPDGQAPGHGVVVGTDGSPVAGAAIGFGIQQAAELGSRLTVVRAWTNPMTVSPLGNTIRTVPEPAPYMREKQALLAESLTGWEDKFPEVDVQARIICGHPVHALAEASADAELLVVGCHGRSVLSGLVMGSVSQGLLHRVSVPMAVVHLRG